MRNFSIDVCIEGGLATKLAIIACANNEPVETTVSRLLGKEQVAEAGRKAFRKLARPVADEAAGGSSSVSESNLTRDEKPSVAVVVEELPDDDREALRCVLAYYDWMDAAVAMLSRHEQEQPDGCDCCWCHDLAGQLYTLEGFLSCLENHLPSRHLRMTMLREDRLSVIRERKGEQ